MELLGIYILLVGRHESPASTPALPELQTVDANRIRWMVGRGRIGRVHLRAVEHHHAARGARTRARTARPSPSRTSNSSRKKSR